MDIINSEKFTDLQSKLSLFLNYLNMEDLQNSINLAKKPCIAIKTQKSKDINGNITESRQLTDFYSHNFNFIDEENTINDFENFNQAVDEYFKKTKRRQRG